MYLSSIINIPLWDRARWVATGFGVLPNEGQIFIGPVFKDREAAEKIFDEWRRNFGDSDDHEVIELSIVEHPDESKDFSYYVHISRSKESLLASIDAANNEEKRYFMLDARYHQMHCRERSPNLSAFKEYYKRLGEYLFVPHVWEGADPVPLFDFAIRKKKVYFKRTDQLADDDLCQIVIKDDADFLETKDFGMAERSPTIPTTPEEIDFCLRLFEQKFINGELRPSFDPIVVDRIYSVERNEEGTLVPDSVDPTLLSIATMVAEAEWLRRLSKTNLSSIQKEYTGILRANFEQFERLATDNGVPIEQLPEALSCSEFMQKNFDRIAQSFVEGLGEFWNQSASAVQYHLLGTKGLKMVYGGNSFPNRSSNLWRTGLLYSDLLVVPDPMLAWTRYAEAPNAATRIRYTFRDCLTALQYAPFAEADDPAVVFCPLLPLANEDVERLCIEAAEEKTCFFASLLMGVEFGSARELFQHLKELGTRENFLNKVKEPEYLLIDVEEDLDPENQMNLALETSRDMGLSMESLSEAEMLGMHLFGRWLQIEVAWAQSQALKGHPLIDAPTSWKYFQWKMEFDANTRDSDKELLSATLRGNAAVSAMDSFGDLENLTAEQLLDAKNSEALNNLRSVIRNASAELATEINDQNSVVNATVKKLDELISSHRNTEAKLRESKKKLAQDLGLTLTAGGIGIASVTSASIPLGVAACLLSMLGVSSLNELKSKSREIYERYQANEQNPVAFFLK